MIRGNWTWRASAVGAFVFSAVSLISAGAQTINWGNASSASAINFDSAGGSLSAGNSFTLGVFAENFDPTIESPTTWAANWTELDSTTYNSAASFFSGTFVIGNDIYEGRQAYIWIYNQHAPLSDSTEWALITDNSGDMNDWTIPTPSDDGNPRRKR